MTADEALLRSLEAERATGMPRWHIHPKPAPATHRPASMHDIDELVHAVTGHHVTVAQLRRVA